MRVTTGSGISALAQSGKERGERGRDRRQIRAELERKARQTCDEPGHTRQLVSTGRVELNDRARAESGEGGSPRYLDELRLSPARIELRNDHRFEAKARRRAVGKPLVHVDDGLLFGEQARVGEEWP